MQMLQHKRSCVVLCAVRAVQHTRKGDGRARNRRRNRRRNKDKKERRQRNTKREDKHTCERERKEYAGRGSVVDSSPHTTGGNTPCCMNASICCLTSSMLACFVSERRVFCDFVAVYCQVVVPEQLHIDEWRHGCIADFVLDAQLRECRHVLVVCLLRHGGERQLAPGWTPAIRGVFRCGTAGRATCSACPASGRSGHTNCRCCHWGNTWPAPTAQRTRHPRAPTNTQDTESRT